MKKSASEMQIINKDFPYIEEMSNELDWQEKSKRLQERRWQKLRQNSRRKIQ